MSFGEDGHGVDDGQGFDDGRMRVTPSVMRGALAIIPAVLRSPLPVRAVRIESPPPVKATKVEPIRPPEFIPCRAYAGSKYTTRPFRYYRPAMGAHTSQCFGKRAS